MCVCVCTRGKSEAKQNCNIILNCYDKIIYGGSCGSKLTSAKTITTFSLNAKRNIFYSIIIIDK